MFGAASIPPRLGAFNTELFPTALRADAYAWANNGTRRIAYVLSPVLVGLAAERIGWGAAVRGTAVFPILALLVMAFGLTETAGRSSKKLQHWTCGADRLAPSTGSRPGKKGEIVTHRLLAVLGMLLLAMLGLPLSAVAQETQETQAVTTADTAKANEEVPLFSLSRLSGTVQADFTNAYYFRGIRQEDDGFIFEPWGELYYNLYKSDGGPVRNLTVGAGVWNSFHTEETGHQQSPKSLYETDWYPIISVGLPENLTLTTIYYWYTSPNDAYRTVQEWNLKLGWDDSGTLGKFALAPWINLAVETHKTSFGPNKGVGLQMGVAPTLYTIPLENYPITLKLPLELGLALHDYYEHADGHENAFGYFAAAGTASVPLAFVPKGLGIWTFTGTLKGYFFSNTLKDANGKQSQAGVYTASLNLAF